MCYILRTRDNYNHNNERTTLLYEQAEKTQIPCATPVQKIDIYSYGKFDITKSSTSKRINVLLRNCSSFFLLHTRFYKFLYTS
jgi:hypothetical protein